MLIQESIADTIVVYMIMKKLIAPWEKWKAFDVGIIDNLGNKLKKAKTSEERDAWTMLDRFVYKLKWILQKFVGKSKLASIFTAAMLLKDHAKHLINADEELIIESAQEIKNMPSQNILDLYRLFHGSPGWAAVDNQIFLMSEQSKNDLLFVINKYQHAMIDYLDEEKIGKLETCLK